jgi:hypothetical protein
LTLPAGFGQKGTGSSPEKAKSRPEWRLLKKR